MSSNDAYDQIALRRPLGSLVGFINISSIMFQIIVVGLFQLAGFFYLTFQPWYLYRIRISIDFKPLSIRFVPLVPHKDHFKENNKSMETTVIFLISIFQYVNLAFVYSKGPPYRKNILTNRKYAYYFY